MSRSAVAVPRLFAQAINAVRPSAAASTSTSRGFATSSASSSSYPFNPSALTLPSTVSSPPPANLISPKKGWSLITHLNRSTPQSPYLPLFGRRNKDRLRTGSVITVLTYTDPTKKSVSPFSGVLMGIKRGGVDTSFRLRNIVNKVGVEMSFKVNSPLIKEIKVVKKAEGRTGGVRDLRRAKVNYLRDRPSMMTGIASAIKASKR
ncbi:ribosomal protein L19 [Kwoniella shandongensis]|uniref:Ribosomal protein L19 n=1 Tax=Kwoniella shandongensis TaxID=1734106 RepID=A0A5M6C5N1_9TREE|nr:ribosomal protein L19 [Kwoniella shandongensis]KAA5530060.1 ribosomal protein L19 [Kwoniella shandongensis]